MHYTWIIGFLSYYVHQIWASFIQPYVMYIYIYIWLFNLTLIEMYYGLTHWWYILFISRLKTYINYQLQQNLIMIFDRYFIFCTKMIILKWPIFYNTDKEIFFIFLFFWFSFKYLLIFFVHIHFKMNMKKFNHIFSFNSNIKYKIYYEIKNRDDTIDTWNFN